MSDIQQLTAKVVEWADSVFPERRPESALLKLFEEVGELVKDPSDGSEYADIMIMMLDLAHMHNIDIEMETLVKLEINRNRVWAKSKTGTLQHKTNDE